MESPHSILIIARPGHDRASLVALLRTLGQLELVLHDGRGAFPPSAHSPDLILVDFCGLDRRAAEAMNLAAVEWPAAHRLALVADIRQAPAACALGAQCALTHSTPAGELLGAVRRLAGLTLTAVPSTAACPPTAA